MNIFLFIFSPLILPFVENKKIRDHIYRTYIELLTPMTPRMEISIARGLAPTICHCLSYSREIWVCKNRNICIICTYKERWIRKKQKDVELMCLYSLTIACVKSALNKTRQYFLCITNSILFLIRTRKSDLFIYCQLIFTVVQSNS